MLYLKNDAKNNASLRGALLKEQCGFCAYTEKFVESLDAVEVEHLDASLKFNDDYFNYYAVLRKPNLYKKDEKYKAASFLKNRFFQDELALNQRIAYSLEQNIYYEIDEKDTEARDFIDFLGFNENPLFEARLQHIKSLESFFTNWSADEISKYLKTRPKELSFITALEKAFDLTLFDLIQNTTIS